MRFPMLAPLAFAALLAPLAASATIDLTRPGALDAIREQDPQQFARIDGILRAAERLPCAAPDVPTA